MAMAMQSSPDAIGWFQRWRLIRRARQLRQSEPALNELLCDYWFQVDYHNLDMAAIRLAEIRDWIEAHDARR